MTILENLNNKENIILDSSNNNLCYQFSEIKSNYGLLDNSIDATYIIHLENDHLRLLNIKNQLEMYIPTKIIYILYNKGYKKCKKNKIKNPSEDLIDSYLQIFKHAKDRNYNNILILEDDFIFNESIYKKKVNNKINLFINNLDNIFIYYLGCVPYIQIPVDFNHNKIILAGTTHACIYSKKIRDIILKINKSIIIDWDIFLNTQNFINRYTYWKPLCYQLFPETENSKNEKQIPIITNFKNSIKKYLNMDKQTEPGYTLFYITSNLLLYIIIILIMMILYFITPFQPFIGM